MHKYTFGYILKRIRKERGITQTNLAKELCISNFVISDWERDRTEPNLETLALISVYFDVSTDYLLTGEIQNARRFLDKDE